MRQLIVMFLVAGLVGGGWSTSVSVIQAQTPSTGSISGIVFRTCSANRADREDTLIALEHLPQDED